MELKLKTEYIIKLSSSEITTLDKTLSSYILGEVYKHDDRSELFNTNLQHIHHIIGTRKIIT